MKSRFNLLVVLCLVAAFPSGSPAQVETESAPDRRNNPNIILIFTDDQGYQDIGCFGSPDIKTPNLDRMAEEGVRFTSFYSACSVCSPSRAALLTGCYPPRVGVTKVLFPRDDTGLSPDEITIAEVLKEQGYATACVGKWHLGHKPGFLPTRQGFDTYYGIPYSNDMKLDPESAFADDAVLREEWTMEKIAEIAEGDQPKNCVPLMRDELIVEYPADQTTLSRRYTEEAVRFISENKDQPFFLYLPHTMPHIPLFVSEEFEGKSEAGLYGDTIEEIDWSVGQIMEALKQNELDTNTLVVYTSDNGPWDLSSGHGGCAEPLRGFKFSTYEGGMRVPCIMRWAGTVPAGSRTDEIASTIDLMPTIARLAGAALPADRVIDGHDIFDLMTELDALTPHEAFYYYRGQRIRAVRMGQWKLHITPANRNKELPELVELFDLSNDISESNNLASDHPDMVESLRERSSEFHRSLQENSRNSGVGN
ncbi:MAG: sulfatase [Planctomycetota bacterium]